MNSKAQVGDIGNVVVFDGLKNHQIPMENLSRVPSMYGSIIVKYRYFIVIEICSPLKLSDSQSEDDVAEKLESDGMTSFGNLWQA